MNTRLLTNRLLRRLEDSRKFLSETIPENKYIDSLSEAPLLPFMFLWPPIGLPLFGLFILFILLNQKIETNKKALLAPVNPLAEIDIDQTPLLEHVTEIAPQVLPENNGMCHGLVRIWHCYDHLHKEEKFFQELHKLQEATKLNFKQTQFVNFLKKAYNSQYGKKSFYSMSIDGQTISTQSKYFKEFPFLKSQTMTSFLKEIIKEALELAVKNNRALIELGIFGADTGHSLGIIACADLMGITIKYFDPNNHKVNFGNRWEIEESLYNFITYNEKYAHWLKEVQDKKERAWELRVYKAGSKQKTHFISSANDLALSYQPSQKINAVGKRR